jgi:hypothetical protein
VDEAIPRASSAGRMRMATGSGRGWRCMGCHPFRARQRNSMACSR